jgi:ribosomal protein S18 acetylase RimI-like enzyme
VLGTVSVVPQGRGLYIRSMAVHPTARGRGIARRLLLAIEEFARGEGYGQLVLTTTPFLAAAIALYEGAGFRLTGERGDLYGTPLLWMAKDLLQRGLR